MANTIIHPQVLAKAALGVWQNSNVLTSLFNRAYVGEFGGGSGDTITVKRQGTLTTSKFDRATGVVVQDIVESSLTLTIKDLYDTSVQITQEQWDYDLTDFAWTVSEPAGRALSRQADRLIAAEMAAGGGGPIAIAAANPVKALIDARKELNAAEVPLEGRFIVVGTDVAAALLSSDQFLKANENGSDSALRAAQIGQVLGMPVYESVIVPPKEAYVAHPDAITFVSIVPQVLRGTTDGATASYDGLGLRTTFGYDQAKKQSLVSFDAYYEVAPLRGNSAYRRLLLP